MKIAHIVPHIDDEATGPAYVVPRLCQSITASGASVELICLAANGEIPGVTVSVHRQWPVLRRFAVSSSLARTISRRSADADIIHNHSLWSMANVAAGLLVRERGAKLVTSPHGTLSSWALNHRRYLKRGLWPLQRKALTNATLIHATSEIERDEIRALGLEAPIVLLPNGIDLPKLEVSPRNSDRRSLLFLSRIHPKKGIDRLLYAWRQLESCHPDWELSIVGRGEAAHVAEVTDLMTSLNLGRVRFPGPLYGAAKARAYSDAELFVLPTHSENFGMVVAEALAHGCPAVVTRGAPWAGLETERCGWWIDHDIDSLTEVLHQAMGSESEQLAEMGNRGRAWMERDFGWNTIGQKMSAVYRWALEGGQPPAWVQVD